MFFVFESWFFTLKLVSVVPLVLVLGFLAPDKVLEQEDDQNENSSDDDDDARHGVTAANFLDDRFLASLGWDGVDILGEPEEGRFAETRASEFLLHSTH
jgi:hypothetical protein